MPCLPIILINFPWATSNNFFIMEKSKFTFVKTCPSYVLQILRFSYCFAVFHFAVFILFCGFSFCGFHTILRFFCYRYFILRFSYYFAVFCGVLRCFAVFCGFHTDPVFQKRRGKKYYLPCLFFLATLLFSPFFRKYKLF